MIISILHFPVDVFALLYDPTTAIDLYVSRADVTFDYFRIHDAELLKQGGSRLRELWEKSRRNGALQGVGMDSLIGAILMFCT